jgi:hypothetical protein
MEKYVMPRRLVITKKGRNNNTYCINQDNWFANKVTTQPIKPTKVTLQYPYIICYSVKHWLGDYLKNNDIQKMFHTKINPTTIVPKLGKINPTTIVPKLGKLDTC